MFLIESQFTKTDVTSVKITRDHYLVGVGGYLHVFDKKSPQLKYKINIFESQKIYGIVPDDEETRILLYSGKYMKIISIDKNYTEIEQSFTISYDWILTAKWIDNCQHIATISMHNKLQTWNASLDLVTEIKCEEKCILYSAHICYDSFKKLVALSGTVFSEVLIWKPDKNKDSVVLKRLQKHKGVIFSVHYNESSGNICSSSDDRSVVLWKPKTGSLLTELDKENIEINGICQVSGHLSRIFRCRSLEHCFLSAGEDSVLNVWSLDGKLIRKIETHQGGPIWSIDANEFENTILTGGSDSGATLFPINCNINERILKINNEIPKILRFLSDNNLIVFCESGALYFYNIKTQTWLKINDHYDLKIYAKMEVSKCRNKIALVGFEGQIYIYKAGKDNIHQVLSFKMRNKLRIFALHWIDCDSFLICEGEGKITLFFFLNNALIPISTFFLPPHKERWSTAGVITGDHVVIGDRKGSIYLFQLGICEPIQRLRNSPLGVTKLIAQGNKIVSLGRNSTVKTYYLKGNALELISSDKLPIMWLVDMIQDLLFGFSGNNVVLWDYKAKRLIFAMPCGGGHRSCDFLRLNDIVTFCYIKNKVIHSVDIILKYIAPIDLIEGYQVKEINSVQVIKFPNTYIIVSGGEDTTFRINLAKGSEFSSVVSLKPHLSSIRAIAIHQIGQKDSENKETYLVFSGGGRAQIICWKLEVFTENNGVEDLICSEQHLFYKQIKNEETEMRIMHLAVKEIKNWLFLFAACSDGNVKVFSVEKDNEKYKLRFYCDIFYSLKCILKLCILNIFSSHILVTMATDGKLIFWDITDIKTTTKVKTFHSIQSHQSGINSFDFKMLNNNLCLFLTGGDDSSIVLNLIYFGQTDKVFAYTVDSFIDSATHSAQITGIFLSDKYFLTATTNQRIGIFEWQVIDKKCVCKSVAVYNTHISDVQGFCCFGSSDFDVFIYGKGIEHIKIKRKS